MNDLDRLQLAIELAFQAHDGQKRYDNKPYIYHPLTLMINLQDESFDTQIAALLHDVVEDAKDKDYFTDKIYRLFGQNIWEIVVMLTRLDGESYEEYIESIKNSRFNEVRKVKIADLKHNLSTIDNIKDSGKRDELKTRYEKALKVLTK